MFNKIFISGFIFFIFSIYTLAQDNTSGLSSGPAPNTKVQYPQYLLNTDAPNYFNSRAFAYNINAGTLARGPFGMWLTGNGITSIASDPGANFIQAGSFNGDDGYWYGVRNGTNALVKIDTTTGFITQIAIVSGATSITGLAWDFTTNQMYALNNAPGASNVGIINLTSAVFTPLPNNFSGTGTPIDMACSNSGNLYVHVMISLQTQSQIYSVNKTTGVFTALPQTTGFIPIYSQGMSWDHSVDTGYLAAFNYTLNLGQLRRIDITTGVTYLVSTITIEADAFAIPGCSGPKIIPVQIQNTTNTTGPYIVNATIFPCNSGVNSSQTKLFWSRNNINITDSVQMINSGGNNWTGSIPGNSANAIYRYYLRAADSSGLFTVAPPAAPQNLFTFIVIYPDTSKPIITHIPLGNCPRAGWPATVNCQVTDLFDLDTVFVRWNKNHGNWTKFNLLHGSGNNWSNTFNSNISQVNVGDSIFYRIIAKDIFGNKDSTILYGFRITAPSCCCIGLDTIPVGYPFYTYYEDSRTDMLFLTSELNMPNQIINYIAFNIISVGSPAMNGFMIKMQTTTATTISSFTNSGWTTVCTNSSYTPPGTGWQYIQFTSPFWYTGGNILVEVCFNNSSWTSNTIVKSSPATEKCVHQHNDFPTGDGCVALTSGTVQITRPNICFTFPDAISNPIKEIPDKYSLFQNYPNPFNPVTQIKYDIPKKSFVTLNIYDVLGRKLSVLVNEEKLAGRYSIDFDGSNFASGVYFYKLTVEDPAMRAENFSQTKKMFLVK